jgi:TIR domain
MPIEIFFSYAHDDEDLMNDVRRQLIIYERKGQIIKWYDRMIPPGDEWENHIDSRLRHAQIILLFVSPAFIESKYCYNIEVREALKRHESKEAHVIPIILRPCAWEETPFSKLQALPKDGRAVSQWQDRDQVCLDIAKSIMEVARRAAKL